MHGKVGRGAAGAQGKAKLRRAPSELRSLLVLREPRELRDTRTALKHVESASHWPPCTRQDLTKRVVSAGPGRAGWSIASSRIGGSRSAVGRDSDKPGVSVSESWGDFFSSHPHPQNLAPCTADKCCTGGVDMGKLPRAADGRGPQSVARTASDHDCTSRKTRLIEARDEDAVRVRQIGQRASFCTLFPATIARQLSV